MQLPLLPNNRREKMQIVKVIDRFFTDEKENGHVTL